MKHPVGWRRPWSIATTLLAPQRTRIALGALLGATATACGAGLLSLAGWLLATAAQHPTVTALSVAVVATRALGVGRGVARYAERIVGHDAALRVVADTRDRIYARLAAAPRHRLRRSGDLLVRLVADTDAPADLVVRGLLPPLAAAVAGAGAVTLATALLWPGGVVLACGLALAGVLVPLWAALAARGPARRAAAQRTRLATAMVDALDGAGELLAHGAVGRAVEQIAAVDTALTRTAARDAGRRGISAGAGTLVTGLTVASVLLVGVVAVQAGTFDGVGLAVLVLTALAAAEVVAGLPAAAARLITVRTALARLGPLLHPAAGSTTPHCGPPDLGSELPRRGDLRVRGLVVAFPGPAGAPDRKVLDGLDLDVEAGTVVGLIGASGAGKSTVAAVLHRLLDPTAGSIRLGTHELGARPPDQVRGVISGVPADPYVFDSTVRENLLLARPGADDDALTAVLRRVGLVEVGLDLKVGRHGTRLSGGMRQRLALARALLVDPAVLVLDESTAHLDPDTRDAVLDDLLAAAGDRAVLLITHDPAVLPRCDRVFTLHTGRAVPADPPGVVRTGT